jgi:hypothetical protein
MTITRVHSQVNTPAVMFINEPPGMPFSGVVPQNGHPADRGRFASTTVQAFRSPSFSLAPGQRHDHLIGRLDSDGGRTKRQ